MGLPATSVCLEYESIESNYSQGLLNNLNPQQENGLFYLLVLFSLLGVVWHWIAVPLTQQQHWMERLSPWELQTHSALFFSIWRSVYATEQEKIAGLPKKCMPQNKATRDFCQSAPRTVTRSDKYLKLPRQWD